MLTEQKRNSYLKTLAITFVLILALCGIVIRLIMLGHDLPYYSIDENDVVEPALAFVAGDWDPKWYKYGPLFSYLLAFVYKCQLWILSSIFHWKSSDFFYAAFFDPFIFYYIARLIHMLVGIAAIFAAFRLCRRYYNKQTAYIVLIFGIAPVLELNTGFTVRIDTMQGLMAVICLYFAINFDAKEKYYKSYVLAAVFAALALAIKPLTGMLLLPAVFVAHLLSFRRDKPLQVSNMVKYLLATNKGLYIFVCVLLIAHTVVHPYSLVNFSEFWHEQYQVVFNQNAQGGSIRGYDYSWLFNRWGVLMALLALCTPLLLIFNKDRTTVTLLTYILTFSIIFMFFKTRIYWYNAIVPVLLIVMAKLLDVSINYLNYRFDSKRIPSEVYLIAAAIIIILSPLIKSGDEVVKTVTRPRADMAAQEWVETNISPGSRILAVGWYAATLPRLRSMDIDAQARWAEYFMYNRNKNQYWVNSYFNAYKELIKSNRPVYDILNIKKHYGAEYPGQNIGGIPVSEFFSGRLAEVARINNAAFIITAGSSDYRGDWENGSKIELMKTFDRTNGYRGSAVKIFRVY